MCKRLWGTFDGSKATAFRKNAPKEKGRLFYQTFQTWDGTAKPEKIESQIPLKR